MEVSLTMWSCSRAQLPVIAKCFILNLVRISLPAAFGFAPSVRLSAQCSTTTTVCTTGLFL